GRRQRVHLACFIAIHHHPIRCKPEVGAIATYQDMAKMRMMWRRKRNRLCGWSTVAACGLEPRLFNGVGPMRQPAPRRAVVFRPLETPRLSHPAMRLIAVVMGITTIDRGGECAALKT